LYVITIAWFVGGFAWMISLAFLPSSLDMVLPAFFFTVAGNLWYWAANHFSSDSDKPKAKKTRKVVDKVTETHPPQLVEMASR
jgi:protein-S-isoprenylcysteine O-methyltransferase Ste14